MDTDDDLRARFNQLFGDAPEPPAAPPAPPTPDSLSRKLRDTREAEMRRLEAQDRAAAQIRALAEEAGIEVEIHVPPSPLRAKMARAARGRKRAVG